MPSNPRATRLKQYDYSVHMSDRFSIHTEEKPAPWPMYSFSRPANILWSAMAERLRQRGWTERKVKDWLQSKDTRWALDHDLGEALRMMGIRYADSLIDPPAPEKKD